MDYNFSSPDFSMDDLTSDAQSAMYAYWQNARGTALLPGKSMLDPVRLPRRSLPFLAVMERVDDGDFRVRIVGTGVRASLGRDITGQRVSKIDGDKGALDCLYKCYNSEAAYYAGGLATWAIGRQKFYTSLMLPFGSPGHVVRILIVFQFTHHAPVIPAEIPLQLST